MISAVLQVLAQCYGNTEEYVINLSILLQWGVRRNSDGKKPQRNDDI